MRSDTTEFDSPDGSVAPARDSEHVINAAAAYAALRCIIDTVDGTLAKTDDPTLLSTMADHVRTVAQNALSRPPRNCDVYPDYGEALSRWTTTNIRIARGRNGLGYTTAKLVFPAWLLAEADSKNDAEDIIENPNRA